MQLYFSFKSINAAMKNNDSIIVPGYYGLLSSEYLVLQKN